MDELDKKLYHDMRLDFPIPDKCKILLEKACMMKEK